MKEEIEKTKLDVMLKASKLARDNQQTTGDKHDFVVTLEQLEKILMEACPCECGFQEPYGFVPEAGCPVHD